MEALKDPTEQREKCQGASRMPGTRGKGAWPCRVLQASRSMGGIAQWQVAGTFAEILALRGSEAVGAHSLEGGRLAEGGPAVIRRTSY